MTGRLAPVLRAWLAEGRPVVRVVIRRARGSTPREAGTAMLVAPDAIRGTIGGGRLESDAIDRARDMLAGGERASAWTVPLGRKIGQCCGGRVWLDADRGDARVLAELDEAERAALPTVLLFGAGHVGRALAWALAPLPLRVRWIDGRPEEFDPSLAGRVEIAVTTAWEREVLAAPAGGACVVLTHSHSLDALITAAALERGSFAYVGLIGSRTKRRSFERAFRDVGLDERQIERLVCPIGDRGIRDKRPEVIAAFVAAEIIEHLATAAAGACNGVADPRQLRNMDLFTGPGASPKAGSIEENMALGQDGRQVASTREV